MAVNPLRKTDRISQIKREPNDIKQSVNLFDIDYAIMSYLEDVVLPTLDDNGKALKMPVIYGNSERWNGARRQGIYRDSKGRIQLPLMMLRRTSVTKNDSMPMLNRHVSYQGVTKYSKSNRYDRFTLLGNIAPKYEIYNITMPDYIEVNYDCMGWTNYLEHLNVVIESLTYAADEYWGDKQKFKFITSVNDYNVVNEVGEGTERINRVEFSLNVKAYLLPEKFDGESTTKKSINIRRTVVSGETDMTSGTGRLEGLLTTPSPYYDNKDLIDFLSLNNSKSQVPTEEDTITFEGIKVIKAPPTLESVVQAGIIYEGNAYDLKIYINGVRYYQNTHFSVIITINSFTINFNPITLGFNVTNEDEITLTGKFIEIV